MVRCTPGPAPAQLASSPSFVRLWRIGLPARPIANSPNGWWISYFRGGRKIRANLRPSWTWSPMRKGLHGLRPERGLRPGFAPRLPEITASTLIVRGERDAARTRAHVEELLARIPLSRAVELVVPDTRLRSTVHRRSPENCVISSSRNSRMSRRVAGMTPVGVRWLNCST